ncbi:SalX ABC-type antimicrobial peptide transport system, ATPase component [Candidatus Nanopelagicaceae bacterium]
MTTVVKVNNLTKTYGAGDTAVFALKKVNIEIEQGDFVAIMGASGSGKSTLMNILGCLDAPTEGNYWIRNLDVADLDEEQLAVVRSQLIGFVFQSFNLIPRTSAIRNVELPMAYQGVSRSERKRRASEALTAVGLADRMEHQPHELSGGQQQRVAIARALVTEPAMVLADEPTGALDTASTHEILELLHELNRKGTTVVVITHEEEVARAARRVIRLRDGEVIEDRTWAA